LQLPMWENQIIGWVIYFTVPLNIMVPTNIHIKHKSIRGKALMHVSTLAADALILRA
jgi:hypothetical protein